jgi:hypothetical protein
MERSKRAELSAKADEPEQSSALTSKEVEPQHSRALSTEVDEPEQSSALTSKEVEPRHSRALSTEVDEPPKQVKKMKVPNVLPPPIEGRTDTTEIPIERRHPGWEENAYQCSTCNCYINKFHINRHNNTFKHKKAVDAAFSNMVENADDNENCIHNISSPE